MKQFIYFDFIAIVDAEGRNVASFYGALRYIEAAAFASLVRVMAASA